jgi:hypothetical protein
MSVQPDGPRDVTCAARWARAWLGNHQRVPTATCRNPAVLGDQVSGNSPRPRPGQPQPTRPEPVESPPVPPPAPAPPRHTRYRDRHRRPNLSQSHRSRRNPGHSRGRCRHRNPSQTRPQPEPHPEPLPQALPEAPANPRRPGRLHHGAAMPGHDAPGTGASGNLSRAATSPGGSRSAQTSPPSSSVAAAISSSRSGTGRTAGG